MTSCPTLLDSSFWRGGGRRGTRRLGCSRWALWDAALDHGIAGGAVWIVLDEEDGRPKVGFVFFRGFLGGGGFLGDGFFYGFGAVGFVVLFEKAVFALESAFGGGFVAEGEIVLFDFVRRPIKCRHALHVARERVVVALRTDAVPLGLGGFEDEVVFERVFGGQVGFAKVRENEFPGFFGFVGEDEGAAASTVFDGVSGRGGAAFGRSGAGAAAVTFFGFGVPLLTGSDGVIRNFVVEHLLSELSVEGGRAG